MRLALAGLGSGWPSDVDQGAQSVWLGLWELWEPLMLEARDWAVSRAGPVPSLDHLLSCQWPHLLTSQGGGEVGRLSMPISQMGKRGPGEAPSKAGVGPGLEPGGSRLLLLPLISSPPLCPYLPFPSFSSSILPFNPLCLCSTPVYTLTPPC